MQSEFRFDCWSVDAVMYDRNSIGTMFSLAYYIPSRLMRTVDLEMTSLSS